MAGTIWIRNDVYKQTEEAVDVSAARRSWANDKVKDAKDELNRTKDKVKKQIEDDKKRAAAVVNQANQAVADFDAKVGEIEDKFRAELGKQNLWYREQLDAVRQDVGILTGKVNASERRLADLRKEYETRWQSMLSKIEKKKSRAQVYRVQLNHTLEEIDKLHPDKLAPGEAEFLGTALAYVSSNIRNEDYDAAIATAQVKLLDAADLQAKLELLNEEYRQVMEQIEESQKGIQKRFSDMAVPEKNQEIISIGNTQVRFDGRIPFWADGLFELCQKQYEKRCIEIEEEAEAMHIEALQVQNQRLGRVNRHLDICAQSAKKEFLESYYVKLLAVRVCEILNSYNWKLFDSGFAEEDERRSYHMSYSDGSGKTVSFVIYGQEKFQLEVYDADGIANRTSCDITKNAVLAELTQHGVEQAEDKNMKIALQENAEAFIQKTVAEADKIKNTRIATARSQMQI